ncbi:zinc-ribbon domain-containing protein [Candidatus Woesearchaeota archaeon]|nr:zinc-ribbon domain-containing protein [Candidatus Woesearchaeota archaeon]
MFKKETNIVWKGLGVLCLIPILKIVGVFLIIFWLIRRKKYKNKITRGKNSMKKTAFLAIGIILLLIGIMASSISESQTYKTGFLGLSKQVRTSKPFLGPGIILSILGIILLIYGISIKENSNIESENKKKSNDESKKSQKNSNESGKSEFCSECGKEIKKGSKFCKICGAKQ